MVKTSYVINFVQPHGSAMVEPVTKVALKGAVCSQRLPKGHHSEETDEENEGTEVAGRPQESLGAGLLLEQVIDPFLIHEDTQA